MSSPLQVDDDRELLDLMMSDADDAPALYQTTNYWKNYERRLVPYLTEHGLRDFRSGKYAPGGDVLHSFGASDIVLPSTPRHIPSGTGLGRIPGACAARRLLVKTLQFAGRARQVRTDPATGFGQQHQYRTAEQAASDTHAKPISSVTATRVGNPSDIWEHDGRLYTSATCYYYLRYAYVSRFLDLDTCSILVELSSGSGKQAEVLAQLHPGLALCLFDVPPQLYVAHQYLSKLFPDRVVGYRETRLMTGQEPLVPGQIYLFSNAKFPIIEGMQPDLFWTAASLGEMEPDVVANYLQIVNRSASHAYLMQKMDGKEQADEPGRHGVLQPTTLQHYAQGLSDFHLVDRSVALSPTGEVGEGYDDSWWVRTPQ